jgi:cytochrome c biogenesis protein CcmG, thiol:disulfide interchange protein DsbE
MKKVNNILIWVIALTVVITTASIVYNKNRNKEETNNDTGNSTNITSQNQTSIKEVNAAAQTTGFVLKDINGKTVKLSDFKGKVVIINFWAVWCVYSRQEMPEYEKTSKEMQGDRNIVLLTVNATDTEEDKEKTVKDFIKDKKYSLPVLLDVDGTVRDSYDLDVTFPTTIIIGRDGKQADKVFRGAVSIKTVVDFAKSIK